MQSFVACFLSSVLLFSQTYAFANTCADCNIYIIKKGKTAPEDGILYNDRAYAEEQARKQAELEKQENKHRLILKERELDLQLQTATTSAALQALRQEKSQIDKLKNDRIKFLEEQLIEANKRGSSDDTALWLALGVTGGILLTVGAAVAIGFASKGVN